MPGFTPNYAWPYQALADPPHGPNLGEKGFRAADATVAAIEARLAAIENLPRGIVPGGYGRRESDKLYTGTEVGVLRLDDVALTAGRFYLVMTGSLRYSLATTGNTALGRLRYTTDGSTPDPTLSTELQANDVNADSAFVPAQSGAIVASHRPGSNQFFSVVLTLSRSGGAGNITMSGSSTRPIELFIFDMGPAVSDTGVDI